MFSRDKAEHLLWPVGIVTSAVYIIVFFTSKFYADMSLQVYYLAMSSIGGIGGLKGTGHGAQAKNKRRGT
jgi:nicotinamide mononucleotide transporter